MNNPNELEKKLQIGEEKAAIIAKQTLMRVRQKLGF